MAAKYWTAVDYFNRPPQIDSASIPLRRYFTAIINSGGGSLNGVNKVTSLASTGPDVIALCTLPGSNFGIMVSNYYIDFGILDTGGASAALVMELGLLLTSTVLGTSSSSLDVGSTTAANAGYFATTLTFTTNAAPAGYTLTPHGLFTRASGAAAALVAGYPVEGALPLALTNISGYNTGGNVAAYPNSGLYDLVLQVTTSANTVSATDAYIRGWVEYETLNTAWQE